MGTLLNPGNIEFKMSFNSDIYVDKSELIIQTNSVLNKENRFVCISRPRRFGKSMAANMLTAYYSCGCDSKEFFDKLKISKADDYTGHLNKYNVIHINMTQYVRTSDTIESEIEKLSKRLLFELHKENPDVECFDPDSLVDVLADIFALKKIPFIFIIDEWDCIFRMHKDDKTAQVYYLDFLRNLLKDRSYVALAYMTGILPIKKYGEHSALNMFTEISITNPGNYAEFTGFTNEEVKALCDEYNMDFEAVKERYDGYDLKGISIYNPRSVVMSMTNHDYDNYWTKTETFRALADYIQADYDDLHNKVVRLIGGEKLEVDVTTFQNDMVTFNSSDDILTLLIHLGYLTYDFDTKRCWIPNSEVQEEFIRSIKNDKGWSKIMSAIKESDELLQAVLDGNAAAVAAGVERCHENNTSILKFNDENSLSCVISLAFYSARKYYMIVREMPAGKGFADLVFLPLPKVDKPALVIELKNKLAVDTAIDQIKKKNYPDRIKDHIGNVVLVGITYSEDKHHECVIEKI